ncbi:predicted GPI-anchored protein 58 [Chanos chanos]|uniref:Predicted GPI-anchored protein 58 n=1 Tax=Chanos chanos TaxID=29144 RepID=A0A6J2VSA5_CHACN|nr:predicted GPI-anchored protein 58 [Chanos chanos]
MFDGSPDMCRGFLEKCVLYCALMGIHGDREQVDFISDASLLLPATPHSNPVAAALGPAPVFGPLDSQEPSSEKPNKEKRGSQRHQTSPPASAMEALPPSAPANVLPVPESEPVSDLSVPESAQMPQSDPEPAPEPHLQPAQLPQSAPASVPDVPDPKPAPVSAAPVDLQPTP